MPRAEFAHFQLYFPAPAFPADFVSTFWTAALDNQVSDPHRRPYFRLLGRGERDPFLLSFCRTDDDSDPPRLPLSRHVRSCSAVAARLSSRGTRLRNSQSQFHG